MKIQKVVMLIIVLLITSLVLVGCSGDGDESTRNANVPSDGPSSVVETITAVERDADANAASYFDARVISETFVDTGFGMYDDYGGCILVFELENISGQAVTVDIAAMFPREHGYAASLIDQDVHFETGQTRQFTHSFGEYDYPYSSHLIIEYMNVRY